MLWNGAIVGSVGPGIGRQRIERHSKYRWGAMVTTFGMGDGPIDRLLRVAASQREGLRNTSGRIGVNGRA